MDKKQNLHIQRYGKHDLKTNEIDTQKLSQSLFFVKYFWLIV